MIFPRVLLCPRPFEEIPPPMDSTKSFAFLSFCCSVRELSKLSAATHCVCSPITVRSIQTEDWITLVLSSAGSWYLYEEKMAIC